MENKTDTSKQVHSKLKKLKRTQIAMDVILVVVLFFILNMLLSAIEG